MGRYLAVLLALLFALSSPTAAVSAPVADAGIHASADSSLNSQLNSSLNPFAGVQSAPDNNSTETITVRGSAESASNDLPDNSTAMLTLGNGTVRSAYVTPSISLGTALDARHAGLRSEFNVAILKEQLARVDSPDRKREIVYQFTYRIEDRIEKLRRQDRQARWAFVNGSISAEEYVQRLARIDAKADRIRTAIDRTEALTMQITDFTLYTRAWSLRFKLQAVTGPVRDEISAIAAGRAPPQRIYVASTDSGVVLSMIDGGVFVREITRLDNYEPGGENRATFDEARRRISELYPLVSDRGSSSGSSSRGTNIGISRFTYTNLDEYGEVTIYFDGRSGEVFKEIRRQRVSLMGTKSVRNTRDNLTVIANYTFPTGPAHVTLVDTESGIPVNGSIAVNGQPIANTGSDGGIWLLAPRGQFAITASRENATVNLSVRSEERSLAET